MSPLLSASLVYLYATHWLVVSNTYTFTIFIQQVIHFGDFAMLENCSSLEDPPLRVELLIPVQGERKSGYVSVYLALGKSFNLSQSSCSSRCKTDGSYPSPRVDVSVNELAWGQCLTQTVFINVPVSLYPLNPQSTGSVNL